MDRYTAKLGPVDYSTRTDHAKGWRRVTYRRERVCHIYPVADLREHVEGAEVRECWCEPKLETVGRGLLVVHNSMDGRELVEEHGLQ
jgi:hypothetical protein